MNVATRAFGIPNTSDITPILLWVVGGLAVVLVVLLVVSGVLKLKREKDKSIISKDDEIIDSDIVESEEEK